MRLSKLASTKRAHKQRNERRVHIDKATTLRLAGKSSTVQRNSPVQLVLPGVVVLLWFSHCLQVGLACRVSLVE
jgi:hypothetical protein